MTHTSNYSEKEIILPAKGWFIILSLIIGLLLNLLPIQGYLLILRPDFVALVLLFWGIYQPERVGISIAFIMGLLMDVVSSSMFGQHALAYSVLIFIALILRRRIHTFGLLKQVPQVGLLLCFTQFIILLTELLKRSDFPGWHYFLASLTGMLLWPLISLVLEIPHGSKYGPNAL
ncbi:MAG: rod shape-determining protein MreD [Nitrosomonadaceae bacterium]|nr:rod shape-determining protein MreD [Nitrosomonadaceae bacterium]|tara:strand:+ start:135 stop:659 length:525 start_codon:yes stop_codon:yes gene_type:complete